MNTVNEKKDPEILARLISLEKEHGGSVGTIDERVSALEAKVGINDKKSSIEQRLEVLEKK